MGGLFSSSKDGFAEDSSRHYRYSSGNYPNEIITKPRPFENIPSTRYEYQNRCQGRSNMVRTCSILRNPTIAYNPLYFPRAKIISVFRDDELQISRKPYKSILLLNGSSEFNKVCKMIKNRNILVISIEKIENPFLKLSYELRKLRKILEYPLFEEVQLFHGTEQKNVDGICTNNLNWRYNGLHTGHRYGQGVCFSFNAKYASVYSSDKGQKVMFLVNVLIGNKCLGNGNMLLPPTGCDTTSKQSDNNIVVVKYEDNEFYPTYKINFFMSDEQAKNRPNHYRRPNSISLD